MDSQQPEFRPKESRPEDTFITLVSPVAFPVECASCSFDTYSVSEEAEVLTPQRLECVDTPDDAFVSLHGCNIAQLSAAEREILLALLDDMRDAARGPLGMNGSIPAEESIVPDLLMRVGPLVQGESGIRATWIEVTCRDTQESLIPDVAWLIGELPLDLLEARDGCLWERFYSGSARIQLEFAADLSGDLRVRPWLSVKCGDEAFRRMALAIRSGGELGPSCLHATVLQALGELLEESGARLPDGNKIDSSGRGVDLKITRVWCLTSDQTGCAFQVFPRTPSDGQGPLGSFEATFGSTERGGFGLLVLRAIPD